MTPAARVSAAIEILDAVLDGARAETALTRWGRANRYAGSKDRAAIRDHVFDALRQRDSALGHAGGARTGRSLMRGILHSQGVDLDTIFSDARFAPVPLSADERCFETPTSDWVNCDIPEWVWPQWCDSLGDQAISIAQVLQQRAPVFLRVNLLKATVDQACASLSDAGYDVSPHPDVPTALCVTGRTAGLQTTEAYVEGLIELQDAHSQASVTLLDPKQNGPILDYCAGGGGKSLALAAWLGELFTHMMSIPEAWWIYPHAQNVQMRKFPHGRKISSHQTMVWCSAMRPVPDRAVGGAIQKGSGP